MKKVLDEEVGVKIYYATTARIRVGVISKAKASFWPKVLEIFEKTDFD